MSAISIFSRHSKRSVISYTILCANMPHLETKILTHLAMAALVSSGDDISAWWKTNYQGKQKCSCSIPFQFLRVFMTPYYVHALLVLPHFKRSTPVCRGSTASQSLIFAITSAYWRGRLNGHSSWGKEKRENKETQAHCRQQESSPPTNDAQSPGLSRTCLKYTSKSRQSISTKVLSGPSSMSKPPFPFFSSPSS